MVLRNVGILPQHHTPSQADFNLDPREKLKSLNILRSFDY